MRIQLLDPNFWFTGLSLENLACHIVNSLECISHNSIQSLAFCKWHIPSLCSQMAIHFLSFCFLFFLPSLLSFHKMETKVNLDNNKILYVSLGIKKENVQKEAFYYHYSDFHGSFIYLFSVLPSFLSYNEDYYLFSLLYTCFLCSCRSIFCTQ